MMMEENQETSQYGFQISETKFANQSMEEFISKTSTSRRYKERSVAGVCVCGLFCKEVPKIHERLIP
jgi:hypothetical protein